MVKEGSLKKEIKRNLLFQKKQREEKGKEKQKTQKQDISS
jgi:hypothetical protein